jgi:integrase
MRGDGRIFQRGSRWWIAFFVDGKEHRLPAGTEDDAKRLLKAKRKEIAKDAFVAPKDEKRTVGELLEALERDLLQRGAKSMDSFAAHRKAVEDALGKRRATSITTDDVRDFQRARLAPPLGTAKPGAVRAPATITRYVETLRQALKLAAAEGKLARLPHFPMLREDNVRRGFFELEEFEKVEAALPNPINDAARFGWLTGWRKGEIVEMTWDQVDMRSGEVRLFDSKNGRGRVLEFDDDLKALMEKRLALRTFDGPNGPALSAYVFHDKGAPVIDFRKSWQRACIAAGVGRMVKDETDPDGEREFYVGRLFHDLRRSAIRDLVRAGVSPTIARGISGHQSDEVFARYDIVSTKDMKDALAKAQRYRRETDNSREHGQNTDNVSALGSGPSNGSPRK